MTYAELIREVWNTNPSRDDRMWMVKLFWMIGDPLPVAEWLGLEYTPPMIPAGMDLDDELQLIVTHARDWIADTYRRVNHAVPALPLQPPRPK